MRAAGIGFAIGAARLPWPGWLVGLVFGLLLSIPDAIITKAYAPIIGMGAIGGQLLDFLYQDSDTRCDPVEIENGPLPAKTRLWTVKTWADPRWSL
ncbi:MAG: hypothetical protein DMG65_10035 [Candidatus Angelobacter sp. Gp1-AA117]|nr:MAG: hypothetical protein DMG65_10035 [Candidatus Angelobacter sp. Gp1-AA117]